MTLKYSTLLFLLNTHQLYVMQKKITLTPQKKNLCIVFEQSENLKPVEKMILDDADVHDKDIDGRSFLWILLSEWQNNSLIDAPFYNSDILNLIHLMIKKGLRINDSCMSDGSRALHKAARNNNIPLIDLFIHVGAKVNKISKNGFTPLHEAAYAGHKESTQLLLFYGADHNIQSDDNIKPYNCTTGEWGPDYPEIKKILETQESINTVILSQAKEKKFQGYSGYHAVQNRQYTGSYSRFSSLNRKLTKHNSYPKLL